MKTNKTNLFMMLFVLAIGSVATVQAGKNCHTCAPAPMEDSSKESESFLSRMHSIQHDLHTVRHDARDCSVASSIDKLSAVEARINELAQDHPGAHMHKTHVNTLRRELKNARAYVKKHGLGK